MRAIAFFIYLGVMFYLLYRGYVWAFASMLVILGIFISALPAYKEHSIRVAKKKIYDSLKSRKEGNDIVPFIEINSAPWYVLAELPGISPQAAKNAVRLRKENGAYPSINVFLEVTDVKHIFVEYIKAIAYVKNEVPPINQQTNQH